MGTIADRAEPRYDIKLDAIVHPERGRTWACTIGDFCSSGMLLEGADVKQAGSLRDSGVDAGVGDKIHVHFSVPGDASENRNYRLTAEVKRVMDNALGVFFPDGMAMRAFRAMEDYATTHEAAGASGQGGSEAADHGHPKLEREAAKKVVGLVRRLATKALPSLYKAFFDRAAEELIVLARDAGSNARQNELFESLNVIEGSAKDVAQEAGREVVSHITKPRSRSIVADRRKAPEEGNLDKLSLVDTDAFEDWLAVANIISNAENRFGDDLVALCMRLSVVHRPWQDKDIMPLSPTVLAATFDDAVLRLELPRDIRVLLYGFYRDALIAFLRKLYPSLNKLLDSTGHLPRAEELGGAAMKRARSRSAPKPTSREDAPSVGTTVESATPAEAPADEVFDGNATQSGRDFRPGDSGGWAPGAVGPGSPDGRPPAGATTQMLQAISAEQSGTAAAAAADAYRPGTRAPMGDMFGTARELMQLRRSLPGPDGLPGEMPLARDVQPAPETVYSDEEVRSALAQLRSAPAPAAGGEAPSIRRRLSETLARTSGAKQFTPEARDAIEVVDDLIGSIRSDAILPESVKGWLGGLEMTYGQLATENVEFLDTTAAPLHPALQLLNELAELGNTADAGEGMDPGLRDQVEGVLAEVRNDYDGDEVVFERALEQIQPLVERQRRAFQGNVRRVVRQSEGSSRLVSARRAVVDAMDERLAGKEMPAPVLELLNPGWRNLLVHSHLRHGPESEEFRRQLEVVDEVVETVNGGDGDADALVEEITAGLEDISFEPGRRRQLLGKLHDALSGGEVERVHVEPGSAAEVLGLEDALPDTAPEADTDDADERSEWERCLGLAKALDVGAWVSVSEDSGRTRILTIAWIGDEHSAFTLVNRKGVKVRDLDLREMVQGLVDHDVEILDEFDMPLMERASQNMLQNMHNQLAYQATHDALTGLMNRKEFERTVDAAVHHAEADGNHGVVIFMDLDQFKVINNTCGHDAGDELLRALVPNLRHELRGVRGNLARLGGDEFGVLVERCAAEECGEIAQRLLQGVQDFRFEWQDRTYALTASVGCVPFSNDGRDASSLLAQADSACYAAKEDGRNRVQIHEIDDVAMAERRVVMEWVAKVDQVLTEDRIHLTAQKIVPLRDPATAKPHYEILMTVLDDSGKPLPPVDFITAAETYDRMPIVDRWIVSHSLNWLSLNMEHLDKVHGFSINLSGTSLNDPGFLDFVVKQLQLTRVPTNKVTFEITETAAFSSMDAANRFIARLRDLGCTFSLDDFGTGLASYSYLRNLDVDYVKIDGMFVKDMVENPADYAVVKSVSEIAHFMGKQTIAEFAESAKILDALREIGVDYAQGWGVEKPKPLDKIFS